MNEKYIFYKNLRKIVKFDVDYIDLTHNTKIKQFVLWPKDEDVNAYDKEAVCNEKIKIQENINGNTEFEILACLADGTFVSVEENESIFRKLYDIYKKDDL